MQTGTQLKVKYIKTLYDHIVQSQTHLNANQLWEIFKNKLNQLIKEHAPHKIAKVNGIILNWSFITFALGINLPSCFNDEIP
jgi:L-lactate utilization protein LutB